MNSKLIRTWLLARPRPAKIELKTGEHVQEMLVESEPNWARIADSVEVIDPDSITAYDANGTFLRAAKRSQLEEGDEDDETVAMAKVKLKIDSETERFRVFADHLAAAYKFATEVAFERMVDLFAAVNRRSESLEKALEATHRLLGKAYQEQVDRAIEQASEAETDPLTNLVGAFVQGTSQAAIEKTLDKAKGAVYPPQKRTNGKGDEQI